MIGFIWNQIKSIFSFLKYVIMDLVTDILFIIVSIKKLIKKEQIIDPVKWAAFKEEMSSITVGSLLKESWYWLLVCLFCIAVGWMLGSRWCVIECNNYIYETFLKDEILNQSQNFWNMTKINIG